MNESAPRPRLGFHLRPAQWLSLAVVGVSLAVAVWVYPVLPPTVASHWDAAGQVNGHLSRFWGTFLMPFISAGLWLLLLILPQVDPKRRNIEKFRGEFDRLVLGLFVFMFYVFCLTLFWNLGRRFDFGRMLVPAIGLLFILMGRMVRVAEPNFTAGIRTPWTLSSDAVWRRTHELGGKLFVAAGVIAVLGVFFPRYSIWLVLLPILGITLFIVAYSYIIWRREQAGAGRRPPT